MRESPVSTHHLEADGVDEGELLIGEASQPSADRLALAVRWHRKPIPFIIDVAVP
jgi:hypothetical protein